ncbi:hypothetical protein EGW08_008483 [Elysia chlorotica]|uniref:Uncharacterized protein n=1 Tax=Elysia chlorotica TaxID=188477 RepID=A0A433TQ54_ELYCH|nr:hypothetical protein EGW08_008483 [Elysia chlorotica]
MPRQVLLDQMDTVKRGNRKLKFTAPRRQGLYSNPQPYPLWIYPNDPLGLYKYILKIRGKAKVLTSSPSKKHVTSQTSYHTLCPGSCWRPHATYTAPRDCSPARPSPYVTHGVLSGTTFERSSISAPRPYLSPCYLGQRSPCISQPFFSSRGYLSHHLCASSVATMYPYSNPCYTSPGSYCISRRPLAPVCLSRDVCHASPELSCFSKRTLAQTSPCSNKSTQEKECLCGGQDQKYQQLTKSTSSCNDKRVKGSTSKQRPLSKKESKAKDHQVFRPKRIATIRCRCPHCQCPIEKYCGKYIPYVISSPDSVIHEENVETKETPSAENGIGDVQPQQSRITPELPQQCQRSDLQSRQSRTTPELPQQCQRSDLQSRQSRTTPELPPQSRSSDLRPRQSRITPELPPQSRPSDLRLQQGQIDYKVFRSSQVDYEMPLQNRIDYKMSHQSEVDFEMPPKSRIDNKMSYENDVEYEMPQKYRIDYRISHESEVDYNMPQKSRIGNKMSYENDVEYEMPQKIRSRINKKMSHQSSVDYERHQKSRISNSSSVDTVRIYSDKTSDDSAEANRLRQQLLEKGSKELSFGKGDGNVTAHVSIAHVDKVKTRMKNKRKRKGKQKTSINYKQTSKDSGKSSNKKTNRKKASFKSSKSSIMTNKSNISKKSGRSLYSSASQKTRSYATSDKGTADAPVKEPVSRRKSRRQPNRRQHRTACSLCGQYKRGFWAFRSPWNSTKRHRSPSQSPRTNFSGTRNKSRGAHASSDLNNAPSLKISRVSSVKYKSSSKPSSSFSSKESSNNRKKDKSDQMSHGPPSIQMSKTIEGLPDLVKGSKSCRSSQESKSKSNRVSNGDTTQRAATLSEHSEKMQRYLMNIVSSTLVEKPRKESSEISWQPPLNSDHDMFSLAKIVSKSSQVDPVSSDSSSSKLVTNDAKNVPNNPVQKLMVSFASVQHHRDISIANSQNKPAGQLKAGLATNVGKGSNTRDPNRILLSKNTSRSKDQSIQSSASEMYQKRKTTPALSESKMSNEKNNKTQTYKDRYTRTQNPTSQKIKKSSISKYKTYHARDSNFVSDTKTSQNKHINLFPSQKKTNEEESRHTESKEKLVSTISNQPSSAASVKGQSFKPYSTLFSDKTEGVLSFTPSIFPTSRCTGYFSYRRFRQTLDTGPMDAFRLRTLTIGKYGGHASYSTSARFTPSSKYTFGRYGRSTLISKSSRL